MTKNIFDQIAPGWYSFRHWSIFRSELEALAQRWEVGKLLNLGCAHGPDFLPFAKSFELYGVDLSAEMLRFEVPDEALVGADEQLPVAVAVPVNQGWMSGMAPELQGLVVCVEKEDYG